MAKWTVTNPFRRPGKREKGWTNITCNNQDLTKRLMALDPTYKPDRRTLRKRSKPTTTTKTEVDEDTEEVDFRANKGKVRQTTTPKRKDTPKQTSCLETQRGAFFDKELLEFFDESKHKPRTHGIITGLDALDPASSVVVRIDGWLPSSKNIFTRSHWGKQLKYNDLCYTLVKLNMKNKVKPTPPLQFNFTFGLWLNHAGRKPDLQNYYIQALIDGVMRLVGLDDNIDVLPTLPTGSYREVETKREIFTLIELYEIKKEER